MTLHYPRPTFTGVTLAIPDGLAFEEWAGLGQRIGLISRAWRWWAGDWIIYGERAYGETYSQAMDELKIDYQQLANCVYVASRFPPSRRCENLSWSFHYEVAKLPSDEGDALLALAEEEDWDRRTLRSRAASRPEGPCRCHCHTQACTRCGGLPGPLSVDPSEARC